MNGCMETDKPLISIVMAVYEPNLQWFKEQLESLEAQTYPNLELLVIDDCSPTVPFEIIKQYVSECIRSFPYQIDRNEKNLGSNLTFEKLTRLATGKYIAYCDQDDIWLPEKIDQLFDRVCETKAVMSYCDMSVIDDEGRLLADSLQVIRPRLQYWEGKNLLEQYFFRNCTAGCSMLMNAETAKKAVPFPLHTVADHWLAIWAAQEGNIAFANQKMVQYRQHHHNQTGVLTGVKDKKSYYELRIRPLRERLDFLVSRISIPQTLCFFIEARINGDLLGIWKWRQYSPKEALLEIAMKFMPESLFRLCIARLRK